MRPSKALSQHFLRDPRILTRIAQAIEPAPSDAVLEIGAGEGTLTAAVAPLVGRVVAIERDARLASALEARVASGWRGARPEVVLGDALALDWHALITPPFKLLGNIPYRITTPLLEKALSAPRADIVVFLVQREVADRLTAAPGTRAYGALTVGIQAVAHVERLFAVAAGAFHPPPKVESAVVRVRPLARPLVERHEEPSLRRFVTACFGQRRRQLRRALRTVWGWQADEVDAVLAPLGADGSRRPETLAVSDFVSLLRAGPKL